MFKSGQGVNYIDILQKKFLVEKVIKKNVRRQIVYVWEMLLGYGKQEREEVNVNLQALYQYVLRRVNIFSSKGVNLDFFE